MTWNGEKIDRFDARASLDEIVLIPNNEIAKPEENEEEMNFERYRDIIECERTHVTEEQNLQSINLHWQELLHLKKTNIPQGHSDHLLTSAKETEQRTKKQQAAQANSVEIAFDYDSLDSGKQTSNAALIQTNQTHKDTHLHNLPETAKFGRQDLSYIQNIGSDMLEALNDLGVQYGVAKYSKHVRQSLKEEEELKKEAEEIALMPRKVSHLCGLCWSHDSDLL